MIWPGAPGSFGHSGHPFLPLATVRMPQPPSSASLGANAVAAAYLQQMQKTIGHQEKFELASQPGYQPHSRPGIAGYHPEFNALLIAEVKKFPCLYNHTKRSSIDSAERMRIWKSIAGSIDPTCSAEFVKKRWLQLRDRYRKELKMSMRQNFKVPVKWCYFNEMTWLNPYLNIASDGTDPTDFKEVRPFLVNVKTEFDEGTGEDSTEETPMYESSLDRVLAATHRHQRLSQASENDISGPLQGFGGGDDDHHLGVVQDTSTEDASLKDSPEVLQLDPLLIQQFLQANALPIFPSLKSSFGSDWTNDEDLLYGRIVGLRMKMMDSKKRKRVRTRIMMALDDSDHDEHGPPSKLFPVVADSKKNFASQ